MARPKPTYLLRTYVDKTMLGESTGRATIRYQVLIGMEVVHYYRVFTPYYLSFIIQTVVNNQFSTTTIYSSQYINIQYN